MKLTTCFHLEPRWSYMPCSMDRDNFTVIFAQKRCLFAFHSVLNEPLQLQWLCWTPSELINCLLPVCRNAEDSEKLKQRIQEEEDRRQRLDTEVQKLTEQLHVIGSIMHSFCDKLQVSAWSTTYTESRKLYHILSQYNSVFQNTFWYYHVIYIFKNLYFTSLVCNYTLCFKTRQHTWS